LADGGALMSAPPFRAPNVETRPNPDNDWVKGCGLLTGIIVLIIVIGKCSWSSDTTGANLMDAMNTANADMGNAIAAQESAPVEPLSAPGIARGIAHLRVAFAAEGMSGAMVYSQNCYDALAHQFGWTKLDQCGGFDMLAVRSLADADTAGLANEAAYFQSEAAAGRYLAAATSAGEPPGDADQRLSHLQSRVAQLRLVAQRPSEPPPDNEVIDDEGEGDIPAAPVDNLDSAWIDRALAQPAIAVGPEDKSRDGRNNFRPG
jgi:hypothetical protein